MKLFDKYKLSLHNIKNNKSRSILTTVIVYIISLLIMAILCMGISFSNNTNNVISQYYENGVDPIKIEYYMYGESEGNKNFDKDVHAQLAPLLDKHKSIISAIKYNIGYSSNLTIGDSRFPMNEYYQVIEGNNIDKDDFNTNHVLVSLEYANSYYEDNGVKLNVGDAISYPVNYYVDNPEMGGYHDENKELNFTIKGFFKPNEIEVDNQSDILVGSSCEIIIDAQYLFSNIQDLTIRQGTFIYKATKTNFNRTELQNKLQALKDDLKNILPKDKYGNNISCFALDDLKMSNMMSLIIVGFACFLCLVLILLSIGSLSNTIMISVDKNKKFIGLLKALGLNEKDLKSTIKLESITTMFLGIFLAFLTLWAFSGLLADLNELLISSMFGSYLKAIDYKVTFTLAFYVPVIVFAAFIAFTLLFARSSMSKIAKTDPMAVISEVA